MTTFNVHSSIPNLIETNSAVSNKKCVNWHNNPYIHSFHALCTDSSETVNEYLSDTSSI